MKNLSSGMIKALTIDPNDVKTLYNKGVALGNLGKYEIAIEWYDKALTINPAYIDALNNKGISLGILGNYTEALDWLDKVLEIDPEDVARSQ